MGRQRLFTQSFLESSVTVHLMSVVSGQEHVINEKERNNHVTFAMEREDVGIDFGVTVEADLDKKRADQFPPYSRSCMSWMALMLTLLSTMP